MGSRLKFIFFDLRVMIQKYFGIKSSILLSFSILYGATVSRAQQGMNAATLGPELLAGISLPQTSSNPQPIASYQFGMRGYAPLRSDFALRLGISYRSIQVEGEATYYSYEFSGNYLFFAPAIRYKWIEVGLDIGTPLKGNFKTTGGGSIADTASSLGSQDMATLVQIVASASLPLVIDNGNQLSLLVSASCSPSTLMTKEFILHDATSPDPITTAGPLGPIETIQVGLTWQFTLLGSAKEE